MLAGPPLNLPPDVLRTLPVELGQAVSDNRDALTSGALSTAATVGEIAAGTALALFALIFFLYDGPVIWRFLLRAAPRVRRERVDVAGRRSFACLVGYVRATALVAVVDAVGIGLGLAIVGVPLVVPLAALVFLGAFVPTVGAVLTGGVAVLVALVANGPIPALVVLLVVIGVQQLEGHVLQPLLLGRAVRLHALAVVLAVAAGVVVAGITGALLAVPLLAVLNTAVKSLTNPDHPPAARPGPYPAVPARPAPAAAAGRALTGVEVAAGGYPDLVAHDAVHEAVLVGDPSGPVALEGVAQGLGLTDALVAVAGHLMDERIDALQDLAVLHLPPEVVLPGVLVPDELHSSIRSCGLPPPASNRSIASSRRRALAGLRTR